MSTAEKAFSTSAGSRRGSMPVPPLNEETLVSGLSNPFGTGGYVLLPGDDGTGFLAATSNLTSPSGNNDSPTSISVLQQQAAAQLEQEYLYTRNTLQQCSRSVLLAIVTSLLDDCPAALTGEIRLRMERVLNSRGAAAAGAGGSINSPSAISARSQGGVGGGRKGSVHNSNAGNGGGPASALGVHAAPWTPNSHAKQSVGGGVPSPYRNAGNNSTGQSSPTSHRKAAGRNPKNKDDDQELCSVHNNMRALKHLQRNPATGLFECIHGFHCLVDGPVQSDAPTAAAAHAMTSPRSNSVISPLQSVVSPPPGPQGYAVSGYFEAPPAEPFHLCYVRGDKGANNNNSNIPPSGSATEHLAEAPHSRTYFDPSSVNEDDLNQLEDLLQSVRDGMRDDA